MCGLEPDSERSPSAWTIWRGRPYRIPPFQRDRHTTFYLAVAAQSSTVSLSEPAVAKIRPRSAGARNRAPR
jgi:hypothetical protein